MSSFGENMDWDLMAKYLSNEVNHFEKKRFESAIQNNEEVEVNFAKAKNVWDEATYSLQYNKIDHNEGFSKVLSNIRKGDNPPKVSFYKRKGFVFMAAASIIVLIISSVAIFYNAGIGSPSLLSFSTQIENKGLVLSDGSDVELNSMSSINYPSEFSENGRLVSLEGEGFFTIAPDAQRPFIISVGDIKVRVVGTAFNIKAYPGDEYIEVTVDHGTVETSFKNTKITLTKGYKVIFNKETGTLLKSINSNVNYNAWKTKKILFEEASMVDVLKTVESAYGIKIKVSDDSILNNRLTANFNHSDIDSVMMLVCRTFNLKYHAKDQSLYYLEYLKD